MMQESELTIVVQGDIRPGAERAIRAVRKLLPASTIIFSTFKSEDWHSYETLVDQIVLSEDPGPLPSFVKTNTSTLNNTNRQLITSLAGLNCVSTGYALKMRTDCILHSKDFIHLFEQYKQQQNQEHRLVVSGFYTRHPRGLACYPFHISDWFVFGVTERVRQFFSAPFVSLDDATWFERNHHIKPSSYAARRFRSRFTPEQHITTHFARELGYTTPAFLNDPDKQVLQAYESFLSQEVIVGYPSQLGFAIEKYSDIENSLYQKIDCISLSDWQMLAGEKITQSQNNQFVPLWAMKIIRRVAHKFRYTVIRTVLEINGLLNMMKRAK